MAFHIHNYICAIQIKFHDFVKLLLFLPFMIFSLLCVQLNSQKQIFQTINLVSHQTKIMTTSDKRQNRNVFEASYLDSLHRNIFGFDFHSKTVRFA